MKTFSYKNPTLEDTLKAMSILAQQGKKDMRIRTLCEKICAEVEPGDYSSEILAIYYWVCNNIRYIRDIIDVETLKTPIQLLHSKAGDCDDIATLLAALYMSCGNFCRFLVVGFQDNVPSHVYCQVSIGGKWVTTDPVAGRDTHFMQTRRVKSVWVFPC